MNERLGANLVEHLHGDAIENVVRGKNSFLKSTVMEIVLKMLRNAELWRRYQMKVSRESRP